MDIYKINLSDAKKYFTDFIGTDLAGASVMSKKSTCHTLFIKDLHVGAANILKQDALSIGADLAVPRGTILAINKKVDAVLIGTTKHFEILARKELSQPFGLKDIAKRLRDFTKTNINDIRIMGIINANNDSFFAGSRFQGINAIKEIKNMINHGATIIDIGAVSSKPGSNDISSQEELERVKPICDLVKENKLYKKATFSIDSYTPSVVEYALKSGFTIVNDI
ncbi:MAG: dihydropteroate synthase, partial [Epsilonproteobacteria bacterium]